MVESIKKTFAGWIGSLITPEKLMKFLVVILGLTLATAWHLYQASYNIRTNTSTLMNQSLRIGEMDAIQRQYSIDITTMNVNQKNMKDDLVEIKQMIRDLPD